MTTPKLYLFVGYPGAGKTTIARLIAQKTGAVHLWADQERQKMFGTPNLDTQQLQTFYERLNQRAAELLAEGKSVLFDTNFNFRKDREMLRQLASRNHAETVILWIATPVEIARIRAVEKAYGVETRVWGNMELADFERLSCRLEPPTSDEHAIEINGANLDAPQLLEALGL